MPVPQLVVFVAYYFWVQLVRSNTEQDGGEKEKRRREEVAVRDKQKEVNAEKASEASTEYLNRIVIEEPLQPKQRCKMLNELLIYLYFSLIDKLKTL